MPKANKKRMKKKRRNPLIVRCTECHYRYKGTRECCPVCEHENKNRHKALGAH